MPLTMAAAPPKTSEILLAMDYFQLSRLTKSETKRVGAAGYPLRRMLQ